MISADHAQLMAKYNRWQNQSIYSAASTLTDEQRKQDRGAFFKSIHGTLNHLLWGDQTWMNRLAGMPPPCAKSIADSASYYDDWSELRNQREAFDAAICQGDSPNCSHCTGCSHRRRMHDRASRGGWPRRKTGQFLPCGLPCGDRRRRHNRGL